VYVRTYVSCILDVHTWNWNVSHNFVRLVSFLTLACIIAIVAAYSFRLTARVVLSSSHIEFNSFQLLAETTMPKALTWLALSL
jgi:hypothetical protein